MICDESIIIFVVSLFFQQRIRRHELLLFVPLFRRTNSIFEVNISVWNTLCPAEKTDRMADKILPFPLKTFRFHFQSNVIFYIEDISRTFFQSKLESILHGDMCLRFNILKLKIAAELRKTCNFIVISRNTETNVEQSGTQ